MRLHPTKLAPAMPIAALLAAAIGCRDSARDVTSNDALQRDLELAQASAVSLAAKNDLPATRFVSALEAGERPSAGRGSAARPTNRSTNKAPRAHAQHAPPAPAAVASNAGAASAAAEEAPAPAPASATVAADAGPAPATTQASGGPSDDGVISVSPTDAPGGNGGVETGRRGRGRGIGGIFGGIIGVVIRGGGVGDDDHCERDHPGARGRYPTSGGYPVGFPTGTYPGGSVIPVPQSGVGRVGRPRY